MVFSSVIFLFYFLPLFLIFNFIFKKQQNLILFLFSLLFYAWDKPIYASLLLLSTIFDYINGLLIEKFGPKTKKAKIVLIVSIVGNLSLLGIFKYTDFIISSLNNLLGTNIGLLGLTLPIGISFYTFQTMSYTIDVYRGIVKTQHSIINFGTYVSMFPQLIAGPIVQYKVVEEDLNRIRKFNIKEFSYGVNRFMIGLIKKVIFANNIGYLWTVILENQATASVLSLWLGIIAFLFQIYFDFSGYSDMAIGLGSMFGFKFLENFNHPYISKSVMEFWRRWHISLGSWFREYVYIPLGGNKKGFKRQIFNLIVVWFLTGLWHGASWNYVIWGLYYGVLVVLEKLVVLRKLDKFPNIIKQFYTLFLVCIGQCIFGIENMNLLGNYLIGLFGIGRVLIDNNCIYYLQNYGILLILCCIFSTDIGRYNYKVLRTQNKGVFILEYIIKIVMFIFALAMVVNSTYNPFLYFRF